MDRLRHLDPGPRAGGRSLSRTSTASSSTLRFPTPASSKTSSTVLGKRTRDCSPSRTSTASSASAFPTTTSPKTRKMPTTTPSGPLEVRSLSATSWRPQYPRIGQFAMTPSEEVVAAGPDGLVYFMRVQDHPSKPWSEPRLLPPTKAILDSSSVTGLALRQGEKGALHAYCVANNKLHTFTRSGDSGSSFVKDLSPPFADFKVNGPPAIAGIKVRYDDDRWCLVAPGQSGGLLFTSTRRSQDSYHGSTEPDWRTATKVAAHLGIISAVSVAVTHTRKSTGYSYLAEETTDIVAACIARARLYSIEGPFKQTSARSKDSWKGAKSIRIPHPGEVTGNPVLLSSQKFGMVGYKLDLLVPSAEGGVFHFIRTAKSPDEWHMIGRISFPAGIPIASGLACARLGDKTSAHRTTFRAHVQCGGRLYLIRTLEGASPWVGSSLHPIEGPGPFPY